MGLASPRLLIVAHDAGGANVLAALWRKYRLAFRWDFALAGPALRIFGRRVPRENCIERRIERSRPDLVLTGTGWQSDLERRAIAAARARGVPVYSYLDHWVRYRDRFAGLPDRILVGDRHAYRLALRAGFPRRILLPVENPYLVGWKAARAAARGARGRNGTILFLSEPAAAGGRPEGAELRAVATLRRLVGRGELGARALSVRLHPAESPDKYATLAVDAHPAAARPLERDCREADAVVGIDSVALLIAASLGRRAVAFDPEGAGAEALPHRCIRRCRDERALVRELARAERPRKLDLRLFEHSFTSQILRALGRAA